VKREYGQYCSLAKALDVVGSRWTLLVIRELIPGPRRFKDLLAGLPGIGTNLLSERLRQLEAEGLLERRTLPPPAGSTVYELTAVGRGLEPAVFELARWGRSRVGSLDEGDFSSPRWVLVAMRAEHDPEAARGLHESYEFRIGDETFHVRVEDGEVELLDGPAERPDIVVSADADTFVRASADARTFDQAVSEGRIAVEGSDAASAHCRAIFAPALAAVPG
jgi:DNA-binding HxlR family transcriptional regulator